MKHSMQTITQGTRMQCDKRDMTEGRAVSWLKNNGYSDEFIEIFFKKENGCCMDTDSKIWSDELHKYMR